MLNLDKSPAHAALRQGDRNENAPFGHLPVVDSLTT